MEAFLMWVVFIGIFIATLQDLKRREVDNFLTFGLLAFGVISFIYIAISMWSFSYFVNGVLTCFVGVVFMFLLYYGRVFAGGDAKLLFAVSPFFVNGVLMNGIFYYLTFIFLMFLCGGVYGLVYSFVLYFRSFRQVNQKIILNLKKIKFFIFLIISIAFFVLGIFSTYVLSRFFYIISIFVILFPLLISFARSLEEIVMTHFVLGKNLREGDLLVDDVKIGKKFIKASFEGLSLEEIKLIGKKRKVKIKEGIPFVPAFLFAFIVFYFYGSFVFDLIYMIFDLV